MTDYYFVAVAVGTALGIAGMIIAAIELADAWRGMKRRMK